MQHFPEDEEYSIVLSASGTGSPAGPGPRPMRGEEAESETETWSPELAFTTPAVVSP